MTNMATMKKALAKAVKIVRDAQERKSDYPKAMMTGQQMKKRTATINCGFGDDGKGRLEKVLTAPQFIAWCEAYDIKQVTMEYVASASYTPQHQVRIYY